MAEPEVVPESGAGENAEAAVTTEEPEVTETPADDSADGEDEDSEGEPAGQEAAGQNRVPYSRFHSVNEKRKAAEAEASALRTKLALLEGKPKDEAPAEPAARLTGKLTPAPASMSGLEQMEHYALQTLELHPEIIDKWFESKFGQKPEAAAATLAHSTVSTRESILTQFNAAAKTRGLDPKSTQLQNAVGILMDTGKFKNFGEAMDAFLPPAKAKPAPTKINGKGAEVDSVDLSGLSVIKTLPRNKIEAGRLASQGKRAEYASVLDILTGFTAKP